MFNHVCVTAAMFVFAVRAHEIFCKLPPAERSKRSKPRPAGSLISPRSPEVARGRQGIPMGPWKQLKPSPECSSLWHVKMTAKKGDWDGVGIEEITMFFGSYIHWIVASIQNRCLKARAAGFIGWKFTCPDRRKITCADQVRFLANNPLPLGFAFGTFGPPSGFCRRESHNLQGLTWGQGDMWPQASAWQLLLAF